ncbi:MAG TPA: GDSL-type esterase/lipase family protein, partial [Acidimicrobiales bacterium]|nr:GDSL-type esterase/lipase family protein [Acidimicrobiales bacterium]
MRSSLQRATSYNVPQTHVNTRALALRGNRMVVIGDSKTYNYGGGWFRVGVQRSGVVTWGGYYATQGFTLAQIQATHLPTVLALSGWAKPHGCVIDGYTNDVNAAGYSFAGSQATLLAIANSLAAAGITPILVCVPPRGDGATHQGDIPMWNAWIRALGARRQWPVLDVWSAVANISANTWLAGLSADQIHPNGAGNRVIGTAVASALQKLVPYNAGFSLPRSTGEAHNMLASNAQLFTGTPVSNGVAGNWGGSGTGCVFSVDTSDSSIAGAWQHMARPSAGTANAFIHTSPRITTGFSVGDRLAFACLYKSTGYEANVNQDANISINFLNSSLSTIS